MPGGGSSSRGGKAKAGGALGKAIVRRSKHDARTKRAPIGTGFHVADLEHSANPLQSVTQASSLEEFMAVATLADRDFTAERAHVTFVGEEGGGGPPPPPRGTLKRAPASGTVRSLAIPRRPVWDEGTTAESLHRAEKDAFLSWRREVALAELAHGGGVAGAEAGVEAAAVTPFEKNIEVWRQLWRVVERCDVLIQILDARSPLTYRCPDLEAYVREVNPNKRCLLLVNKADFLSAKERLAWARYFSAQGLDFVFFSALREQRKLEEADRLQYGLTRADDGVQGAAPMIDEVFDGLDASDPLVRSCRVLTRDELLSFFATSYADMPRGVLGAVGGADFARSRRVALLRRQRHDAHIARRAELRRRKEHVERLVDAGLGAHVRFGDEGDVAGLDEDDGRDLARFGDEGSDGVVSDADSISSEELLREAGEAGGAARPALHLGMVGYPNVGKSSTINALSGATAVNHGAKRVAVASTPGKTKHFQTIILDDDLVLEDCPGLVFPSFIHSREEMVVSGILPIDQLRDHTAPIRLVCQRIPRTVLESVYGFTLPKPEGVSGRAPLRQPTPTELLDTFCRMRGFMAAVHSGFDHPRGARILLKDYCEGKIAFCHPPPNVSGQSLAEGDVQGKSGGGVVSLSDNVLLPAFQGRPQTQSPVQTLFAPTVDHVVIAHVSGDQHGDDSSDEGNSASDADLHAFSRVVPISMHDESVEIDGLDQLPVIASIPPSRAPRVRGLGRFGSKRKGERASDPYGTAIAADAAMRGSVLAEIAAVSRGPAVSGVLNSSGPLEPTAFKPSAPLSVSATQRVVGVRDHVDVGGARVLDAVPSTVRGQQSSINTAPRVSFPAHLLDAALQLQQERERG